VPRLVRGGRAFQRIVAGSEHANFLGELGDGTQTRRTIPVLVLGPA